MAISADLGTAHQTDLPQGVIHYRERGAGPTLVFVHGLLVTGDLWRQVVPELARSFRCITPDWPLGAHATPLRDPAAATIGGVARLVSDFLEAMDLDDVTLVANDTGGAITQVVMTEHPARVSRVVLTPCDCFDNFLPPLFRPLQHLAKWPALLTLALQSLRIPAARRLPFALGWLTKRPIDRAIEDEYVERILSDSDVQRDCYSILRDISPAYTLQAAEKFGQFDGRVLVAWAPEDRLFPKAHAERLSGLFRDCTVETIDDSYTFVSEDNPKALVAAIERFMARA